MKRKEDWIEEILLSSATIAEVNAPKSLDAINLMEFPSEKIVLVPLQPLLMWAIAASIILLIGMNSLTISRYSANKSSVSTNSNALYSEYFSYINQ